MRSIIKIEHVEKLKDKKGKTFYRTHALVADELGNEEEAIGYGKDFKEGDTVQYFFHYNVAKMVKSIDN